MKTKNEHTKKSPTQEALLTIQDVKAKLNVSRYTIYKLTEEGKLPVVKLTGNCFRYKSEDVTKLIAAAEVSA